MCWTSLAHFICVFVLDSALIWTQSSFIKCLNRRKAAVPVVPAPGPQTLLYLLLFKKKTQTNRMNRTRCTKCEEDTLKWYFCEGELFSRSLWIPM